MHLTSLLFFFLSAFFLLIQVVCTTQRPFDVNALNFQVADALTKYYDTAMEHAVPKDEVLTGEEFAEIAGNYLDGLFEVEYIKQRKSPAALKFRVKPRSLTDLNELRNLGNEMIVAQRRMTNIPKERVDEFNKFKAIADKYKRSIKQNPPIKGNPENPSYHKVH
jgi:hypothetical protein